MAVLERNLFLSCPISKGPDSVVSYLEKMPAYVKNKVYEYVSRDSVVSVIFNALNASFFGFKIIDEKSLFLLNYFNNDKGEPTFLLFQVIYYFENQEDKNLAYRKISDLLENELALTKQVKYDMNKYPYQRYFLPCGSGFNLKHSKGQSDKHFIDILWAPNAN